MKFTFAGTEYEGRAGETLAAALVRNGVLGGFRSIYRGRPRGVYTAGEEEPNALVQIGAEPMLRATLVELYDGLVAEPLAGKGRLVARARGAVRRDARALRDARRRRRPLGARRGGRGERARDPRRAVRVRAARRRSACSSGRRWSRSTTATTCSRSSAAGGSGGSARSGSCSRPARSSGRRSSPTTTGPGLMLAGAAAAYGNPDGVTAGERRLEPARPSLEPGARPPALGRPHRRARARRRAAGGRVRRPRRRARASPTRRRSRSPTATRTRRSSTSSATSPSPTSAARSAPASARSST